VHGREEQGREQGGRGREQDREVVVKKVWREVGHKQHYSPLCTKSEEGNQEALVGREEGAVYEIRTVGSSFLRRRPTDTNADVAAAAASRVEMSNGESGGKRASH